MMRCCRALCLAGIVLCAQAVFAGQALDPPTAGGVIRDASGQATVRAHRLVAPLELDGRLDESIYSEVQPFSDFIQIEPNEGQPPTERTEAWILFDDDNVYLSARCFESQPNRSVNEMRRDQGAVSQSEHIGWAFDTFHDRRNAAMWIITPV